MPPRFVRPWRLKPPEREAQKDRRQRAALAEEIEKFRRLVPEKRRGPDLAERQREAFFQPERTVARGFGEAATEDQFGPFREEDIIRIGGRGAARFKEELTTDPIIEPGGQDTGVLGLRTPALETGRQPIPAPEATKRAKDVLRVRDALDAEGMSVPDFQAAVQAGLARQQGDDLPSSSLTSDVRTQYNAVIERLGVKTTPTLPEEPRLAAEPDRDFLLTNLPGSLKRGVQNQETVIEEVKALGSASEYARSKGPDVQQALARVLEVNDLTVEEYDALSSDDRLFAISKVSREPFPGTSNAALNELAFRERPTKVRPLELPRNVEQAGREAGAVATTAIRIAAEEALPGEGRPSLEAVREGGLTGAIKRSIDVPVAPDVLNPLNLIPVPIIDPLVARALGLTFRVGQRITRSLLTRLGREAAEQATSETLDAGTRIALREFSEEVERASVLTPGEAAEVRGLTGAPARAAPVEPGPRRTVVGGVEVSIDPQGQQIFVDIRRVEGTPSIRSLREVEAFVQQVARDNPGKDVVAGVSNEKLAGMLRRMGAREIEVGGFADVTLAGEAAGLGTPTSRTLFRFPPVEPGAAPAVRQAAPAPPEVPRPATREEVVSIEEAPQRIASEIRSEGNGASRLADEPSEVTAARERVVAAEKSGRLDTGAKAALDDAQEVARVAEARASDEAVTADMDALLQRANRICETI